MITAAAGGPGRKGQIIVSVITVIHLQAGRQAGRQQSVLGVGPWCATLSGVPPPPTLLCCAGWRLGFSGRKVCLEHTLLATDIASLSPEQQNPS